MPAPAGGADDAVGAFRQAGVVGLLDHGHRHVADGCRSARRVRPPPRAGRRSSDDRGSGPRWCRGSSRRRTSGPSRRAAARRRRRRGLPSAARRSRRSASGCLATTPARWSLISRASATPSAPGTRSGPGPLFGQHLHGDAGVVHRLEALLAELGQKLHRARLAGSDLAPLVVAALAMASGLTILGSQGRDGEMLFERDDTHGLFLPIDRLIDGLLQRALASASGDERVASIPSATRPCSSCRSTPAASGSRRPR